jgi:hypothetical protein
MMILPLGIPLFVAGITLMALGMGVCNTAMFKLAAQEIPHAIGGTAG